MATAQLNEIAKFENEVGTPNKPPRFLYSAEYQNWRIRFLAFIQYNDPELMVPLHEEYMRPRADGTFREDSPLLPIRMMTTEQRKEFDKENKAHAALTMCLTKDVLSCFKDCKSSKSLWDALSLRFGGNAKLKKSRRELLKSQFDMFDLLSNESIDNMLSRYSQLICELREAGEVLTKEQVNVKLLESLPKEWDSRMVVMENNEEMPTWSLETLIGMIQVHQNSILKKAAKDKYKQNPSLYSTPSPSSGGMAFFSGSECASPVQSESPYGYSSSQSSAAPALTASTPQTTKQYSTSAPTKLHEEHVALFTAFLTSYEAFLADKTNGLELTEEDFDQIHPDDLEEMDIEWNMAMLTRRAKRFLQRTGKTRFGRTNKSGPGFDKSKVRCYNCQNLGHFARECEKPKQPASGITRPTASRTYQANQA